jgi:NAD(P)-dependent dehydrogenase (short-subunit alcohol dehydrogenase family)
MHRFGTAKEVANVIEFLASDKVSLHLYFRKYLKKKRQTRDLSYFQATVFFIQ